MSDIFAPQAPVAAAPATQAPIELLAPGSELHTRVLGRLVDRLKASEEKMSMFYDRWRVNERKVQAYVNLPDYERLVQQTNNKGQVPKIINIQVPYSFAVIQTVVTYMLHTFCGRQPIFQVGVYDGAQAGAARNMEILLQFNADSAKLILQIYEMLLSAQIYQFGAVRIGWEDEVAERDLVVQQPAFNWFGMAAPKTQRQRQRQVVYSGNTVTHIDPFLFFPDPNVPMTRVNKDGDYVFWRSYKSQMWLLEQEMAGVFKHTRRIEGGLPHNEGSGDSERGIRSQGDGIAGQNERSSKPTVEMRQIDEGTVKIVPAEWGLGDSQWPERWLFTIVNKKQIVRAERFEANHNLHPVAVIEPYAIGTQFGSIAMADIVGPVQDHISWLLNSHMQNVRGVINNRLVVNPHYVNMDDLKKDPGSGEDGAWLLRMKQAAFGVKPSEAIYQLNVQDVTAGHIKNVELMIRFGHMWAGVNENLMGLQDSKGRKTATEVRTSGEAGASRLAAQARIASAQGLVDVPLIMGRNIQQRMDPGFMQKLLGNKMAEGNILNADFYYPINDGTLPLDRAALLQVWQQILTGVAQDPELRANYSLPKLFAYVADLGGARNIDSFKTTVVPDAQIEQQLANGSVAPLPQAG